ncbi:class I SAM-dependent methyltransferase [Methylomarinum vadi]|uniref:hypothetical protein n=1 Tax=Methylomarinum vadi TaxID=438855 RepID=UPI0004DEF57B|nr:hypothetical protein [Methylomarinum vadi]
MNKFVRNFVPYRFWPSTLLRRWIERKDNRKVLSGPFKGMKYVSAAVGSSYEPKLLGTYELELHDHIFKLISLNPRMIVDVGAAEGYYAIGMAIKCMNSQVIAFEANPSGRQLLTDMAKLNGVQEQVEIRSLCDVTALQDVFLQHSDASVLIMDVEGAEKQLLDPTLVPQLFRSHILVEIHDYLDDELGDAIADRFASSHEIEKISIESRFVESYPFFIPFLLKVLFKNVFLDAICEYRHPNSRWFYLTPRR